MWSSPTLPRFFCIPLSFLTLSLDITCVGGARAPSDRGRGVSMATGQSFPIYKRPRHAETPQALSGLRGFPLLHPLDRARTRSIPPLIGGRRNAGYESTILDEGLALVAGCFDGAFASRVQKGKDESKGNQPVIRPRSGRVIGHGSVWPERLLLLLYLAWTGCRCHRKPSSRELLRTFAPTSSSCIPPLPTCKYELAS